MSAEHVLGTYDTLVVFKNVTGNWWKQQIIYGIIVSDYTSKMYILVYYRLSLIKIFMILHKLVFQLFTYPSSCLFFTPPPLPPCSICLNLFHLLTQKPNLERKKNIYSNKFFHNFHLSVSSFTCSELRGQCPCLIVNIFYTHTFQAYFSNPPFQRTVTNLLSVFCHALQSVSLHFGYFS